MITCKLHQLSSFSVDKNDSQPHLTFGVCENTRVLNLNVGKISVVKDHLLNAPYPLKVSIFGG